MMTLKEYMERQGWNDTDVAALINVHRTRVCRYRNGHGVPSFQVMARIETLTNGKVRTQDFVRSFTGRK